MMTLRILGIAALLACAGAVLAYPTLSGPSGMAVIPSATIADPGLSIAADWQDLEEGTSIPIRLLYTLGSNAELGIAYNPFSGSAAANFPGTAFFPLDQSWGVNAKLGFDNFLGAEAALGAQYIREEFAVAAPEEVDYQQVYFAWTTPLRIGGVPNTALNLGVNWTRAEPEGFDSEDAIRGFAGLAINVGRSVAILAEYQTEQDEVGDLDPISAITARFALSDKMMGQVGFTNALNLRGLEDHSLFAGLYYAFGGCRTIAEE